MATCGDFLQQLCLLHALNLFICDIVYDKKTFLSVKDIGVNELESENESDNDLVIVEEEFDEIPTDEEIEEVVGDSEKEQLDNFYKIIEKVRSLMTHFSRSKKSRYILREYSKLGPIVDCKTRWSTLCLMLERILALYPTIQKASVDSAEIKEKSKFLTESVLSEINKLLSILQPVKDAVTELSKEDNPWSNILAYLLNETHSNEFYTEHEDSQIIEIHKKVFYKISFNSFFRKNQL